MGRGFAASPLGWLLKVAAEGEEGPAGSCLSGSSGKYKQVQTVNPACLKDLLNSLANS